jgi:hypothetical protein
MKWKQISPSEITDMPLYGCYSNKGGGTAWSTMTNAKAETFSEKEGEEPRHIHFYVRTLEEARKIYLNIKNSIPTTIKTFSIEPCHVCDSKGICYVD